MKRDSNNGMSGNLGNMNSQSEMDLNEAAPPKYEEIAPMNARSEHNHLLQFYETEEHLYNVITCFVAPVVSSRDAAIIIATKTHLEFVEDKLRARHVDVEKKVTNGQLMMIDANELLVKLVSPGGKILSLEFERHIGELVRKVEQKFAGRVYAYGELVNILSQRGDYDTAIELENLWNMLLNRHKFILLCGYDMSSFKDPSHLEVFKSICSTHSKVTPSETYTLQLEGNTLDQSVITALLQQRLLALETEVYRHKTAEAILHHNFQILSSRAQEALFAERDHYANILSILPVGVYGTAFGEDDGYYLNKRFCEIVGRSDAEIRLSGWLDAVYPDDRQRLSSQWPFSGSIPSEFSTTFFHGEYRFVHSDGTTVWVNGETVPNRSENGTIRGYVHTIVDVSDLKCAEKERFEAQRTAEEHQRKRAEEAERNKYQQELWIDSLCHELRNPLNGVYGNTELLEQSLAERRELVMQEKMGPRDLERLREQLKHDEECVQAIFKCVAHQKIITDDVLNLSKLEQGKTILKSIEFDPKATISDVAKMFEAYTARKGLDFRLNFSISNIRVRGDPHRLSQVIINLVANAIKFTPKGSITITLDIIERQATKTKFRVSILDTGLGMTEEEIQQLFQRFTQPSSTTIEYGGSGLGLYLSKGLVELMGGTISVESKKNVGSTFTFTFIGENLTYPPLTSQVPLRSPVSELPIELSKELESASIFPMTSSVTSNSITKAFKPKSIACSDLQMHHSPLNTQQKPFQYILVVEDNEINQKIMVRFLENKGYSVTVAHNGLEALDHLFPSKNPNVFPPKTPDLIFMDIQMPVMDGITATLEIRRRGINIPIIGLSGNAREEHAKKALRCGMDRYVTKPIKKMTLYQVIEEFET
ncbi:uncharacterized protein VTP21DRAFT_8208 [Calcarisporiella thermophila]|uniref:uncharacterized protein n=1 Tax=Calcarisporiella thermophila TaxID=911321 RepID=UPI00374208ED